MASLKVLFYALLAMKGLVAMNLTYASAPDLDEKIGQMIMVGFEGVAPTDPGTQAVLKQAEKGLIGGVIFFSYNLKSPEQVQNLTTAFREARLKQPLFLAIDQEGGKVQRLKSANGFTDFLSAYEVASQMTPQEAEGDYQQMASQTANAGFNLVFGPVVDLHADPRTSQPCPVIGGIKRSYSSNPEAVVAYARAFINAHHHYKLLTSLKHFPGHGYATKDSHQGMVDITETHVPAELTPFDLLSQSGLADMMMTAHLMLRQLDTKYPATLSPTILQKLLRQGINYKGVVISDDLHMGAIGQHYALEEIVVQAVRAGCDVLLFSNNQGAAQGVKDFKANQTIVERIHQIIKDAIAQGVISEGQINASYERIIMLKQRL
jgi:beta-N-acetylhexosaminidase